MVRGVALAACEEVANDDDAVPALPTNPMAPVRTTRREGFLMLTEDQAPPWEIFLATTAT